MKKQYMQPIVNVIILETKYSILSGSPIVISSANQDNDVALGREFDYGDDFDE